MNNTPQERIRIFGRDRYPLAEFRAPISRSWSLFSEGRAQFTYPTRKTDLVTEKNLQFGNYLLIESDTFEPWVGVIDTPRAWSNQTVTISAYTPERIFSQRIGPMEKILGAPPGTHFSYMIKQVNYFEPTALTIGQLWEGGVIRQVTYNPNPMSEYLKRLQEKSGENYRWRPVVENDGRLTILCDWSKKIAVQYDALLHEGTNGGNLEAAQTLFTEDGKIINYILGYGSAATWAERPATWLDKDESINKYGLRMAGREYRVSSIEMAWKRMNGDFSREAEPLKRFSLTAINVGDTFKYIKTGNVLKVQMQHVGFSNGVVGYEGSVRIIGLSYDPVAPNKVRLVVEEYKA